VDIASQRDAWLVHDQLDMIVKSGALKSDAVVLDLNDDQRARILTSIPAGRMGAPEEIASAIAFLASDEAGYVTGQTIHVNGGMAMI
jgi:NAD(P)-dependent dehydrogenase (short-subunit alcohol dehydrogenase family)